MGEVILMWSNGDWLFQKELTKEQVVEVLNTEYISGNIANLKIMAEIANSKPNYIGKEKLWDMN